MGPPVRENPHWQDASRAAIGGIPVPSNGVPGADVAAPRRVQFVQQEPSESLNPRMSIRRALREACGEAEPDWLRRVRLPAEWIDRPAGELSEGQRARIAILRAGMALQRGLLILDESLAGLDPSTRGHILSFLCAMQQEAQPQPVVGDARYGRGR